MKRAIQFGSSIPEIPLTDPPLVNVIAQLRFPTLISIEKPTFIADFQEAIRKSYPILRPERQLGASVGPGGISPGEALTVWRFESQDPDSWLVTLTQNFVSISARKYTSRQDLLTRMKLILESLKTTLDLNVYDRIGVRYVDRLTGTHLNQIDSLINSAILGLTGNNVDLGSDEIVHSLTDTLFQLGNSSQLRGRWGRLPAGAIYDPAVEPSKEPSWILDLDHYSLTSGKFDTEFIGDQVAEYCNRIYAFFRWAVTDAFLEQFGAIK